MFLGHFGVGFGAKAAAQPWVVGNDPVVIVDFQGMIDYAKVS